MTTRRGFLAVAGLAMLPANGPQASDALAIQGQSLARLISLPAAARHIAAIYLAGIRETDWRRAASELNMEAVLASANRLEDTETTRAWLGARIRADFHEGAVLDVDGWRLSRTEVGACVLAAGAA